jgi:acyl-CoA dehydrogenase
VSPTVPPWMDDELALHSASVERFVVSEMLPQDAKWRAQHHVGHEIWRRAGELGLLCMDIPAEYGGAGGDFRHEVVLYEALARRALNGFGQAVHSIVAHYLLNHGTDAQKQRYLPQLARGELVGAIAMSEPGAGSDLQSIKTRAERLGTDYVLSGSKTFITNGYLAGLVLVVAKTDPSQAGKGISLFLLETHAQPGYRVGRLLEKIGQHAQDTAELFFDQVRLPAEALLGGIEGQGFAQLMGDLPYERVIVAVQAQAAMEGALAETIEYARSRQAFGRSLLEFQNTRFRLAEAATQVRIGRCFLDRCIQEVTAGTLDAATASMAKWWLTDTQQRVIDECLQLHGGYGYMNEYLIARLYADARVTRIYGGTNEVMKELIARAL